MTHPPRLFTIGLAVTLVLAILVSFAKAQTPADLAVGAKKAHNDCVYGSVLKQLESLPSHMRRAIDMSMATETAFTACLTEEQALLALLRVGGLAPQAIEAIVLRNKLDLKRDLQAIAANPDRYR